MELHSRSKPSRNACRHHCWPCLLLLLIADRATTGVETFAQGSVVHAGQTAASSRVRLKRGAGPVVPVQFAQGSVIHAGQTAASSRVRSKKGAGLAHSAGCLHAVASSDGRDAISGVILPAMAADDPAWLSFVITRYLDEEWMEQDVHRRIGDAVAKVYADARASGEDDLISVLASLSYGLKDAWRPSGFDEAFEGPVDVANRAAELLMLRMGKQVWSYGASNDIVQERMLNRLEEYEAARQLGSHDSSSSS
eukprot:TRINITY_DN10205_c0_g1_i1.p1 TRINITY_DN10205_c0_g1~~TRINITY_DN10205_c0_g1_i1.p1  ORF type:complete len:252 (+),score=28.71 TRINITY_DN10205_c0_g1_i1:46-801(+)